MIKIPNIHEVDKTYVIGPARLRIERDDSPENPWKAWDEQPPMATFSERRVYEYKDYGSPLRPLKEVSNEWISEHWSELCGILNLNQTEEDKCIENDLKNNEDWKIEESRSDVIAKALEDMTPSSWRAAGEYFEALEALWKLVGVKALSTQVNGYSQGDSTLLLLVGTPKYLEATGIAPDRIEHDLESSAKLYGAWAFGDVYGYILKDEDDEELDSCWGFYGCPWGNNPEKDNEWSVAEEAMDALKNMAPHQAEKALKEAKEARQEFLALRREYRLISQTETLTSTRSLVANACREKAQEYLKQKKRIEAWAELAATLSSSEQTCQA